MRKAILLIGLLMSISLASSAQELPADSISTNDSTPTLSKREMHRQRVAQRNLHYNILGGPGYTPDFGFVLGGSALMTFSVDPSNPDQQRSVLPVGIAFMFRGGINLFSKPQIFFKGDKFRIFGKFAYKNTEDNFYGIGYSTNRDYIRSDSTSKYRYSGWQINPYFLFRLGKSNFFLGPLIDLNYDHFTEIAEHLPEEPSYIKAGGTAEEYKSFISGLGLLLTYDSRDVPANAYRGWYLEMRGTAYNKLIGSDVNFARLEIDYRQYVSVGNRRVLAWTLQTKNVFGTHIPLTQYAMTGSPFDLRGYYLGQYRDKSSHVVLAEYRHMFNTDRSTRMKRLMYHVGFAAWAGCGFMGPTMGKIEGVLPNFGAGLRIEIQPRMNIRLDLGKNTVNNETLFYFNVTEAF